jgi:indole-3-glycerol phosphate synthase
MKSTEDRNANEAAMCEAARRRNASCFPGVVAAGGVLDRIVEAKASRILSGEASKASEMGQPASAAVKSLGPGAFLEAISASDRINVVAEIKRRSPSKGLICTDFDPLRIAESYSRGGAAALSVLTEEDFFDGSLDFLRAIRSGVNVPLLRKDFIFAEPQVYESKAAGADAMLLITAILRDDLLARLIALADELGIAALVEVHSAPEMERALVAGAAIIGVNNRDLTDFTVSLDTSFELAAMAPPGVTLISESGISTGDDIARLRDSGYSAVLVGEHLMRAAEPGQALAELIAKTKVAAGPPM